MAAEVRPVRRSYVVIGGGIAGVTCAEQLSQSDPSSAITLVSSSDLIKAATNFKKVTRALEEFDVEEMSGSCLSQACPNVRVCHGTVCALDATLHEVYTDSREVVKYDRVCICTGGRPNLLVKGHPRVLGIRDTESVADLTSKMATASRIVVVGNGGIAMEFVYEVKDCEVIWAIKDSSIGTTFFDEGAAKFFLSTFGEDSSKEKKKEKEHGLEKDLKVLIKNKPMKRMRYMLDSIDTPIAGHQHSPRSGHQHGRPGAHDREGLEGQKREEDSRPSFFRGSALGPDWSPGLGLRASNVKTGVHMEYQCEVEAILSEAEFQEADLKECKIEGLTESKDKSWPVYVKFTSGKHFGCDLVVSATGVLPTLGFPVTATKDGQEVTVFTAADEGVEVDGEMRTSLPDVYAAGDVCSVDWKDSSALWFQMRLWCQARQMGAYAAQCMVGHTGGEQVALDFCFELFAHVTTFFGFKVVLLGRFNAQGLGRDYELLLRYTQGMEYIKVVLQNGRMVGAVLIGDTELEETFENLMLNQMDLSHFGAELLNPDVDIEDYFD